MRGHVRESCEPATLVRMPASLLEQLDQLKGDFSPQAARKAEQLLKESTRRSMRDTGEWIHLHETLLFFRAYPQNQRVLDLSERLLGGFGRRLKDADREAFEDPEISGVSGTGLTTNFSHPFALSLAKRHGGSITIDWESYENPERLGRTLAVLIPEAFEDWAIASHPDWQRWFKKAHGTARWLIERVDPATYDLLEVPLRWEFGKNRASRTLTRIPRKRFFFHTGALLARRDISLEAEFAKPALHVRKLTLRAAQRIIDIIIDASACRYRELYGFLYPDVANVFHCDFGRGMDFYFFRVPSGWRLPSREYCAGMYFKNGVPVGYVEVIWTKGVMEVGFNLYYTFRQGETAWLYAQLLKLFRERFKLHTFTIDPYQIGHENDEAIESGAFWFYYKLGFRPRSRKVAALAREEAGRIAVDATHRTRPAVLRKLAAGTMEYRVPNRRD